MNSKILKLLDIATCIALASCATESNYTSTTNMEDDDPAPSAAGRTALAASQENSVPQGRSGFASALGSVLEVAVGAVGVVAQSKLNSASSSSGSSYQANTPATNQLAAASTQSASSSNSGYGSSGGAGSNKVQVSRPPGGQIRALREWSEWRTVQQGLRYRIFRISKDKDYNELIGQFVVSEPSLYMYKYQIEVDNQLPYKVDFCMELKQPDINTKQIRLALLYILQIDANSKNGRGFGDVDEDL